MSAVTREGQGSLRLSTASKDGDRDPTPCEDDVSKAKVVRASSPIVWPLSIGYGRLHDLTLLVQQGTTDGLGSAGSMKLSHDDGVLCPAGSMALSHGDGVVPRVMRRPAYQGTQGRV